MCEEQQGCLSVSYSDSHHRVICITGVLPNTADKDYDKIDKLIFKLIRLDMEQAGKKPIILVINGPGGDIEPLLAIRNTINFIHSPVYTVTGGASSASAYLFILGKKGYRYIFRDSYLLLHLGKRSCPSPDRRVWQFWKKSHDNEIEKFILRAENEQLAKLVLDRANAKELLSRLGDWRDENDSQKLTRGILSLLGTDQVFSAEEAVRCGLADKIIGQEEFGMLFR